MMLISLWLLLLPATVHTFVPIQPHRSLRLVETQIPVPFRLDGSIIPSDEEYETDVGYDWQAGNAYEDFDKLKQAISKDKAEQNLQCARELATLDAIAASWRPLWKDLGTFVAAPLLVSMLLTRLVQSRGPTRFISMLVTCADAQFWLGIVAMPILLLLLKKWQVRQNVPLIESPSIPNIPRDGASTDEPMLPISQLKRIARNLGVGYNLEDPSESCNDHILCLLEQWTSSVAGTAILGLHLLLSRKRAIATTPWVSSIHLLTRLGAMASIHQYQGLLFELQRQDQPRPLRWFQSCLQRATRTMTWFAPLGLSVDLALTMASFPSSSLKLFAMLLLASCIHQITGNRPKMALTQRLGRLGLLGAQGFLFIKLILRALPIMSVRSVARKWLPIMSMIG